MSLGEIPQATGSRAIYQTAIESSWGTVNGSPNWRTMRMLPGEAMDIDLAIYKTMQMRGDRGRNASVRGTQKPGGTIPFELSANGWNNWFYQLLGGAVATTGPAGGLSTPGAPTATPSTTGGVLPAATNYQYKITALSAVGETVAGTANSAATTTGTTSSVALSWTPVSGATGYKIYGRTTGSFLLVGYVGTGISTWTDTGNAVPTAAAPVSGSSGSAYQHVFAGFTDVPVGFTLEKAFTDIGWFYDFYGCRINKMDLDFSVDKIPTGTFDVLCRQAGEPAQASLNSVGISSWAAPVTDDPFTSVQIQLTQAGVALGTAESVKLSISNNFYATRGYVLGSPYRQNLRPGDRTTDASGDFMFLDNELYEMAIRGDKVALTITATNGIYSVEFAMTQCQFIPNKTTPKAKDEGPISITANIEALTDNNIATDVTMTIKTPESSIVT